MKAKFYGQRPWHNINQIDDNNRRIVTNQITELAAKKFLEVIFFLSFTRFIV